MEGKQVTQLVLGFYKGPLKVPQEDKNKQNKIKIKMNPFSLLNLIFYFKIVQRKHDSQAVFMQLDCI